MALSANTTFETRAGGGNDNNGGAFVTGAAGTDRSQQASPQVVIDNSTITTSITAAVVTFTGGTYTATSADVGNIVQMLTGTNVTAGFYQITAQTGTTWTLDRTPLTSGTTTNATGNMGGALATLEKALAAATVSGNTTYAKGAFSPLGGGMTTAVGTVLIGYGTTRGDNVQATADASGMTAASNTITPSSSSQIRNLAISNSRAIAFNGSSGGVALNCSSINPLGVGFSSIPTFYCSSNGSVGDGFHNVNGSSFCYSAGATGSGNGFTINPNGSASFCVAYGNAGAGFANASGSFTLNNCVAYGNTGIGFKNIGTQAIWSNLVAYGNTGSAFSWNTASVTGHGVAKNLFQGSNGSASTLPNAILDDAITALSADPFVNAAGGDFRLNTTAGGGAALRAAGFNAILGLANAGFLDVGALQHADAGGVSGGLFTNNLNGGMA